MRSSNKFWNALNNKKSAICSVLIVLLWIWIYPLLISPPEQNPSTTTCYTPKELGEHCAWIEAQAALESEYS